jgi:hypothetical protein
MARKLVKGAVTGEVSAALCLPPLPSNIAVAISIGAIVLVQLNYVIAPRVRWLYQL